MLQYARHKRGRNLGPWNLTPEEWSNALLSGTTPEAVATNVRRGALLPWTKFLLKFTEDSKEVLDLGCGAGQNSALLAYHGRKTTLLDVSKQNLNFSKKVLENLNLSGQYRLADMTKPLPFGNNSFDTVFSVGVFEYFTDKEIKSILKEAFRISRKRVIIMVPNALSLAYRVGYWISKATKKWIWGGERPFYTLRSHFETVADVQFFEFTVAAKHSLDFLTVLVPKGNLINRVINRSLSTDDSKPAFFRQGYLLVSVGEKR
jgi:ubiquinone/menaquinone biosynthesis C-methylase UbiE